MSLHLYLLLTLVGVLSLCQQSLGCDAGFTGQSCDIPICSTTGSVYPPSGHTNYGYLINGESLLNCNLLGFNAAFYVDTHSSTTTVDVLGSGGNPSIRVHNDVTNFPADRVLVKSANRIVEQFDTLPVGRYAVNPTFSRPVGCVVQISAQTNLTISLAFAPNAAHSDDGYNFLPDNVAANILVHVASVQAPGNATSVAVYQNGNLVNRLNLVARSNCAYEYYTPNTVKCERLHTYYVEVFGTDELGNSWMRSANVPCIGPAGR